MVKQISEALEARELLKVSVLQNCDEDKTEVAKALVKGAKAELVQTIGNVIVLTKNLRKINKLSCRKGGCDMKK